MIPAVILVVALMSILSMGALLTAQDERLAARAVRESINGFYAAEAGLAQVWGTWDDTLIAGLSAGDSLDLGWQELGAGASYRAVLHRLDNGGQQLYDLIAEGRGAGRRGGQRLVHLGLSKSAPYPLCCQASVRGGLRGERFKVEDGAVVSGLDTIPEGWGSACPDGLEDIPGVQWRDGDRIRIEEDGELLGKPASREDPNIAPSNLFDWGHYDYGELKGMRDATLSGTIDADQIGPKVTRGRCDTFDPTNWGAPDDPTSPCFHHFPIIYSSGDLRIRDGKGVGQGILLVDGSLEIEDDFTFYGIVIVKGSRLRLEDDVRIYGGIIAAEDVQVDDGAAVRYSQCAVNRSAVNAEVTTMELLSSRSWGEVLR